MPQHARGRRGPTLLTAVFPKGLCRMSPSHLEAMANQELEQHATLRQSSALQSELRILAASKRRALPAIQFAQRLMLGLRCVRSAYQARLSAWLHLASTALSDPTRPGEEDEASQVVINPPSRDLQRWLASPRGNAFVREIRWALLPCEVAVRRLRAVAPCQRLRDQALAHALLDSCSPPAHLACVAACCTCGGLCLPTWDSPAKPCPWCRGHPGPVCPSCNTVIHTRGSCRWNSGAHPSYVASGEVNIRLCPDCWRAWAWSLAAAPRRHPPPTLGANLLQHLRNSARRCNPGAGSGTNAAPSLPTRKVRRWLLQHLEGGELATLSSLLQELRAWAPAVADDWLPIALTRAIRALSAEGRILIRRDAVELVRPQ